MKRSTPVAPRTSPKASASAKDTPAKEAKRGAPRAEPAEEVEQPPEGDRLALIRFRHAALKKEQDLIRADLEAESEAEPEEEEAEEVEEAEEGAEEVGETEEPAEEEPDEDF